MKVQISEAYKQIQPKHRQWIGRVLAILFVIAISVFIFSFRDRASQLALYGYPGVFMLAFLTSATVILPAPGLIVVFSMGAVLNPVATALAAGSGAALGELSGYLAGVSGRAVVEQVRYYDRVRDWMENHERLSSWLILFLAFLPVPIFDVAGIAAGALKMPVARFLIYCWVGKILKMLLVAYLGLGFLNLFD